MQGSVVVRDLGIEEWHRLGMEGNCLPVVICLEGDSMRPLIRRGCDKVTVVPVMRPLKVGDIVLFKGGEKRFVVHRVQALRECAVCTLGDNCFDSDGWRPLEDIWGLVVQMERDGHTYSLDSDLSRVWGRVWMNALPLRRLFRRFRHFAAKCFRRAFGNRSKGK